MSTKTQNDKQRRVTRQIRISSDFHRKVKLLAAEQGKTISILVDGILNQYFPPPVPDSPDGSEIKQ